MLDAPAGLSPLIRMSPDDNVAVARGTPVAEHSAHGHEVALHAIAARGFVFMEAAGYDPVANTGQLAGGCNMIGCTTGRGPVPDFRPAPSLKFSANTPIFERMRGDMDVGGGTVVTGMERVEQAGTRIFAAFPAAASGEPTRSETLDDGDNEFVLRQVGAVM